MARPTWKMLHPRMTVDHLGFLPQFFDLEDKRPAKDQLHDNYRHGGGYSPMKAPFKLNGNNALIYPGDPPMHPLAEAELGEEKLIFYDHALMVILQPDRSFVVVRVD